MYVLYFVTIVLYELLYYKDIVRVIINTVYVCVCVCLYYIYYKA